MSDLDESDLERCRHGDVRALQSLWEAYGDRVYRLCRGLLGQAADAEDAAQEVLLRVFAKAGSFTGRSRLSTWVYRLTVNYCLNRRRDRRRAAASLTAIDAGAEPRCPAPSPLEASSRVEEVEQLERLLGSLPQDQRAVLVLREIEGLSYRACADVLAIPIGTVMSRLSRGRERLAELLALRARAQRDAAPAVLEPTTKTNGWKR